MRTPGSMVRVIALALITALALALRVAHLGAVRLDPFYDAAVRSMGLSWHNFFFGAYEPAASVSIDKPPIDLWLQVASVKLFGWGSTQLKLPQALAGTASVPLLYAALARPFGASAGLVGAATLAVLPIEVITARSDTMDAVMMMLLVVALLAVVLAINAARPIWLLLAAAALGVAFNVKLLESLVAVPGLLAIAWLGLPREREDTRAAPAASRVAWLAAAAVVYVVVALSWLGATLLFPAHERPYAIGSSNGSAWNAAFVFNGAERLSGKTVEVGQPVSSASGGTRGRPGVAGSPPPITAPSPVRLLARGGQIPGTWLGWEALLALLLGAVTIGALARDRSRRLAWATAVGAFVWLLTGCVLFSAMARLHPRYLESFTPAVAATVGIGVSVLARRPRTRLLAVALLALLAIPLTVSIEQVGKNTSDAGNVGALASTELRALSTYLRAHQGDSRYEVAASAATSVASLIVRDARPVLMLTSYDGLPLTSVGELGEHIARGEVRYAFLDSTCPTVPVSTIAGCAPAARWVRAHGSDVSREAGLRRGLLWRLPQSLPVGTGRSQRSVTARTRRRPVRAKARPTRGARPARS